MTAIAAKASKFVEFGSLLQQGAKIAEVTKFLKGSFDEESMKGASVQHVQYGTPAGKA